MEIFLMATFAVALVACISAGHSILFALSFGLMIFSFYAAERGHSPQQIFVMWKAGVRPVKTVLLTLLLIGVLTAYWRAAGVIPAIIFYTADFFSPSIIVAATFWLCGLISTLIGTAFGSAATMGVICAAVADSLSVPTWLTGGAVLSGIYLGDRCSPMSTSALLVATLTRTDVFKNIVGMIRTSIIPLTLASVLYLAAGIFFVGGGAASVDAKGIFARNFDLSLIVLTPAVLIVVLSLLRLRVQLMMLANVVTCAALAFVLQGMTAGELLTTALLGYYPADVELAKILSGGGLISMASVVAIVGLSSCYAGIFQATGFLNRLQDLMIRLGKKFSPFASVLAAAIITNMIACNQTLAIMLTHQLCRKVESRADLLAIELENSAVVVAPLIPWAIANVVPLTIIAAPPSSALAAWYLYLIPLCCLASSRVIKLRR